ncbi:MAG: hypothetical protein HGB04_10550 [Chlorobiaceae bacterium]|nr:hypothetical protein [Chlorobiaceae bacterium]
MNNVPWSASPGPEFLRRLALLVKASSAGMYGIAMMTNHVHLLVKSGSTGLHNLMRRLGQG